MELYGLKNCDTCRKALKEIAAAGREVTFVDVRADGVAPEVLAGWLESHGTDVMVNRRSTTWRGLDQDVRDKCETTDGAAKVLAETPSLMKRPVIVDGANVHVGWTPAVKADVLG